MHIGNLAVLCEAKKSKLTKEDKLVQKDYDDFKAHNELFARKWGLKKHDLADNKGLTAKGGALAGAGFGALYGLPLGPAGMAAGAIGGALGAAGGTKLNRYMVHKTYGHLDKKSDPDW